MAEKTTDDGGVVSEKVMTRWRHKKRGTFYTEVGRGKLQHQDHGAVGLDMLPVVIYRAESDGSLWVRPVTEFEDGRFEEAGLKVNDVVVRRRGTLGNMYGQQRPGKVILIDGSLVTVQWPHGGQETFVESTYEKVT